MWRDDFQTGYVFNSRRKRIFRKKFFFYNYEFKKLNSELLFNCLPAEETREKLGTAPCMFSMNATSHHKHFAKWSTNLSGYVPCFVLQNSKVCAFSCETLPDLFAFSLFTSSVTSANKNLKIFIFWQNLVVAYYNFERLFFVATLVTALRTVVGLEETLVSKADTHCFWRLCSQQLRKSTSHELQKYVPSERAEWFFLLLLHKAPPTSLFFLCFYTPKRCCAKFLGWKLDFESILPPVIEPDDLDSFSATPCRRENQRSNFIILKSRGRFWARPRH